MDEALFLPRDSLQQLLDALIRHYRQCVGPRVRDGAIVYEPLDSVQQLPAGMHDRQAPGEYRLEHGEDVRVFAWANGPQALKPLTFAPEETLWEAHRDGAEVRFFERLPEPEPMAVIGVRGCDLAALRLQDQHFLEHLRDPYFAARRDGLFLVAVHCSHPADTCFCASTGDGPTCTQGFDLALHELDDGFVVDVGSEAGARLIDELSLAAADEQQLLQAKQERTDAAAHQRRSLPQVDLYQRLFARQHHARWEDVGARCLSCGNCTSVCPTCFCSRESEQPQLDTSQSLHARQWDSCFTESHSLLHGRPLRATTVQRYRQWLTHKLGGWIPQYGRSGCVGCGRCISWCPVGIDITEEAMAIAGSDDD